MWGPRCDQLISQLSCGHPVLQSRNLLDPVFHRDNNSAVDNKTSNSGQQMKDGNFVSCNRSEDVSCLHYGDMKFYSLNVVDPTSVMDFMAEKINASGTSSPNKTSDYDWIIQAFFRRDSMPDRTTFDFSAVISDAPYVLQIPGAGQWYVGIRVVSRTDVNGEKKGSSFNATFCFSFLWKLRACPPGMAGPSCSWIRKPLQVNLLVYLLIIYYLRIMYVCFSQLFYFSSGSYYLPLGLVSKSGTFHLESLMNYSMDNPGSEGSWIYLNLEIPRGASGSNLHVQLKSDSKIYYEIYAKFGGLPSDDSWDYYSNSRSSENGSMVIITGNNEDTIDFYLIYAREGSWVIGIRANSGERKQNLRTTMTIELKPCPGSCSSHGSCRSYEDETGLSLYRSKFNPNLILFCNPSILSQGYGNYLIAPFLAPATVIGTMGGLTVARNLSHVNVSFSQ